MIIFTLLFGFLSKIAILGFRCKTRPKVGQRWIYKKTANSPWFDARTSGTIVTITAIEKGWVQFDWSVIKADTAKLDIFVRLFRYVKD
jgi:hypothetical protein